MRGQSPYMGKCYTIPQFNTHPFWGFVWHIIVTYECFSYDGVIRFLGHRTFATGMECRHVPSNCLYESVMRRLEIGNPVTIAMIPSEEEYKYRNQLLACIEINGYFKSIKDL